MAKISELIKILRGQGDVAGARRAERIGDEAPYAAERIDAETLRSALSRGDNANSLAIIKPEDFKYLAAELPAEYLSSSLAEKISAPAGMSVKEYIRHLGSVAQQKGFEDIPFLEYGQHLGTSRLGVTGHEGRHRMRALEGLGDEKALVRLLPRASVREPLPRRSRSEFLDALAEKYGIPLRLDPEGYESIMNDMSRPVEPFSGGGLAKFFSAVDEAVANLRQKKGTGEQMLKQIQQSPGVKKEELELRQIPQKLAGQQKVTQEDVQAMIKAVPAPKLQMTERGGKGRAPVLPDFDEWLNINEERKKAVKKIKKAGFEPVQNPEDPAVIGFMEEATGDILDYGDARRVLVNQRKDVRDLHGDLYRKLRELEEDVDVDAMSEAQKAAHMDEVARVRDELENVTAIIRSYDDATDWLEVIDVDWEAVAAPRVFNPKFEGFAAEGPKENYRELLIQLQPPGPGEPTANPFVYYAHFPEEDIVVHARVDDRRGPNGEKILFVEEIQSDWHQEARGRKTAQARALANDPIFKKQIKDEVNARLREKFGGENLTTADLDNLTSRAERITKQVTKEKIKQIEKDLPKDLGYAQLGTRVPPWQQTSHELAVKQILDTAANEGYDKVMFAPGSEQVRRYSLGTYVDEMSVEKNSAHGFTVKAKKKDGTTVTKKAASEEELQGLIGTDMADNVLTQFDTGATTAKFEGEDLLMGGDAAQGKRKIYDEIIPQYLSKYAGKEFNVQPGRSSIQTDARSLEQLKQDYRYDQFEKKRTELQRRFEEGDLDPTLDADLRDALYTEATLQIKDPYTFQDKYAADFLDRFAPKDPDTGKIDYAKLGEVLEESSFDPYYKNDVGRAVGSNNRFVPEKIRFKDPVKQAEFAEWFEDAVLERSTGPRFVEKLLKPRFAELATKELDALGEALYADMPQPKRLEGVSIDITPEMREKIRTRGQPLFAVPPAVGIGATVQEEEPVQEYKEAGRVEKKKGMEQEQFESPFDESRRIGPKPGVSKGPAKIRDLTKILRGEETEAKNLERQRIEGNVAAGRGLGEYMYDMVVPQSWWEFPLEAAFLPVTKPVRKALLATAGAMYDPEAEAGKLTLLHGSPSKITRTEPGKDLWGTTDPGYAMKRAMDKMKMARGAQGPGYLNRFDMEEGDLLRLTEKYSPEDIEIAGRAFGKLPRGTAMTGEEIYQLTSQNQGAAKTKAMENVARAMGKKGYQVPSGVEGAGDWYRILDQVDVEPYGKGGIADAIKGALKLTDEAPNPSRRKAIGLRQEIAKPGALTTVETEVSASDMDTLQKALGNVGQAILNEPVSRREVLKRGALSAASNLIPGGGVLQQVAKEVAPMALRTEVPVKTEAEIAEAIAKYANDFIENVDAINAASAFLVKQPGPYSWGWPEYFHKKRTHLSPHESEYVLEELRQSTKGSPEAVVEAAKAVGLDIASVANATGLSVEDVRRVMSKDADLLENVTKSLGQKTYLEGIIEDGRRKAAAKESSYLDLFDDKFLKGAAKRALKKLGKDADEDDLFAFIEDEMRAEFRRKERLLDKKSTVLQKSLGESIVDDEIIDRVYNQAADDSIDHIEAIIDYLYDNGWTPKDDD